METFDPFRPSDPIDSPANDTYIPRVSANVDVDVDVDSNGTEPENENGNNWNSNNGNNGHQNGNAINITFNSNCNHGDETDNCRVNNQDRDHQRSNSSNSDTHNDNDDSNDRNINTRNDIDDDNDEEDDIAFAAEAAANAVEEADAEQQRLDQALLRCRICGQGAMEGRPILRFLPMNPALANLTTQALPPGSPALATFPDDICLHIFCGKTASILPSVNQPDMEILTKAGIKNKHGIGAEVNAALARTRCANIVTLTLGAVSDTEETPSSATPKTNSNTNNKQEKQYFLVREFEAHLAAIRSSHQAIPVPVTLPLHLQVPLSRTVQVPGSFLGDPAHASQQRHLTMFPSSIIHGGGGGGGTLPNGTDRTKRQHISQTNAHSTTNSTNNSSSGNNMHSSPNYLTSQGLIQLSTNRTSFPYTSMDGSTASSTPQLSPDAPTELYPQSPASPTSTNVLSTSKMIGSPSTTHDIYSCLMTSSRTPQVNVLVHQSASSGYPQALSEPQSQSQASLRAGAVGATRSPRLKITSGHAPLPRTVKNLISSGSSLTPPVAMGMDTIVHGDQGMQSLSSDDDIPMATHCPNGDSRTTPISPTRAAAGKTVVKPKTAKQSMHSLDELYSSPPENHQCTSDGKVKCGCGGTFMYAGTPKGAASWRSHVVTKRHQKWLRTQSKNAQTGINIDV